MLKGYSQSMRVFWGEYQNEPCVLKQSLIYHGCASDWFCLGGGGGGGGDSFGGCTEGIMG